MTEKIKTASEQIKVFADEFNRLRSELDRVFIGHDDIVTNLLSAMVAEGHVLLEGVPGLGKTLLARSLAECLKLQFSRIQFTPDLMPADITGSMQLLENEHGNPQLVFRQGPLVANLVLADEINRATPKTQSALLEAMQEYQVTAGDKTIKLPRPYMVIATQNPIEQEGTYPLPEAELDRFMIKLNLGYPREEDYARIIDITTGTEGETVKPVCSGEEILHMRKIVREVLVEETVKTYAIRMVMASQPTSEYATDSTLKYLVRGGGPRAVQAIILMSKVYALLDGRSAIGEADICRAYLPVMRHRVAMHFDAHMEILSVDDVLHLIMMEFKA